MGMPFKRVMFRGASCNTDEVMSCLEFASEGSVLSGEFNKTKLPTYLLKVVKIG